MGDLLCLKVCYGFMACPGSFPSCFRENHPDPKSGRDVDPDKLGHTTFCQGDETSPTLLCAFFYLRP